MYTLKKFLKEDNVLRFTGASYAALFKHRKIWSLASQNWKKKKVSLKTMETAKKLYNAVKRHWKLTDSKLEIELELDSNEATQHSKQHERILIALDNQGKKVKNLAKQLGLTVYYSTFIHIAFNNSDLM